MLPAALQERPRQENGSTVVCVFVCEKQINLANEAHTWKLCYLRDWKVSVMIGGNDAVVCGNETVLS